MGMRSFFGKESYDVQCARCHEALKIDRYEVEAGNYRCPNCGHENRVPEQARTEYKRNRQQEEQERVQTEATRVARERARQERENAGAEQEEQERIAYLLAERREAQRLRELQEQDILHRDDTGPRRADEVLRVLAWINMVAGSIGGLILIFELGSTPISIAMGLASMWWSAVGTAFLLTVAQIARALVKANDYLETAASSKKPGRSS